ncbi:hypothetical protein [Neptunomonas qingdaonensis]|nr:hypothetical protein [Neptunomonas qingdaonensis]
MERKLKKTHPQDLPSLALSRSNPTHPNSQLDTLPKYTPNTRTLKRYTAVSVNNLINRYSVTAYSLSEARSLLPAFTVVTSWTLVKELAE